MKKIVCILLSVMLLACACAQAEQLAGGWNVPESTVLDENALAACGVLDELLGCSYTPVALLGTQVVAGCNYAVLCKSVTVTAQPQTGWTIAYIYAALDGTYELLQLQDLTVAPTQEGGEIAGGWALPEDTALTEEAAAAAEAAFAEIVGCSYAPELTMGTQVVAGINYCLLVKTAPIVPDAEAYWTLAYIYAGVDGTVTLNELQDLPLGLLPEEAA